MGTEFHIVEQLSQARLTAREELPDLARRTGVRQENLRAIEEGRFADLPAGIYGRAAIRSYANAYGFDGTAILAACEPWLTPVDEPIAALARARGLRRPVEMPRSHEGDPHDEPNDGSFATWRHLAAAAIDAGVIAVMLLVLVFAALTLLIVPVSALRDAGGAFAIMGGVLAGAYYLWFGGVRGTTIGERTLTVEPRSLNGSPVTLRVAIERALLAATEDARCIQRAGERLGRSSAGWMSNATGEAKG